MPPLVENSDSDAEEIPHRAADPSEQVDEELADAAADNDQDQESQEDEDEDQEEDAEVYVVESVMGHNFDFDDGKVRYHIRWKGYPKKKDYTWEPEENLGGAKIALAEYFEKIGGKPVPAEKGGKKRQRQSLGETPEITKKADIKRKSNGASRKRGLTPLGLVGSEQVDENWKPPKGSWENEVQSIETIERSDDGKLYAFILWNQKGPEGKFYRSKTLLNEGPMCCYEKCPKKMLRFYEGHLVFTESRQSTTPSKENGAASDQPQ